MYCGRPAEQGSRAEVLDRPLHPYTRMLLASTPFVDPARRRVTVPVRGELPSQVDPPPGCAFASRCPYAAARCTAERPALRDVAGRKVACHFAEAIA
ncbi:MAG: oligopeptide/dipeptide ABC transporter ATP-binding protein [Acetobacteraceae bacterium]